MRIDILPSSATGNSSALIVAISHNGQTLNWDISPYSRSRSDQGGATPTSMFDEINAYLAQLSAEKQYRMFELYRAIREELNKGYGTRALSTMLQGRAKQLYELAPFEEVDYWVRHGSGLRVPPSFKTQHGPDDPRDKIYLDQTYLYTDYQQLITLTVAERLMVPIWGEFLKAAKLLSGNTSKEQAGLKLLFYTNLISSPPMLRLRDYIGARVDVHLKDGPSAAAVMGGMGSSEMPEYLQAITVVRRLSVCAVVSPDDNNNLVTNVHQFVKNNLSGVDKKVGSRFNGTITDKEKSAGSRQDESNDSLLELHKIKTEISDGDAQKISVYPQFVQNLINHIDPTIPAEYVDQCMEHIRALDGLSIQEHQSRLMQWVASGPIPVEGADLMSRPSERTTMAVVQAALWHWGYHALAVMVTATPVVQAEGVLLGGTEIRGRMPKEIEKQLLRDFPHHRQPRQSNAPTKYYNPAVKAIEAFCALAVRNEWQLHAPVELKMLATQPEYFLRYEITADKIRVDLANLLLKITQ